LFKRIQFIFSFRRQLIALHLDAFLEINLSCAVEFIRAFIVSV